MRTYATILLTGILLAAPACGGGDDEASKVSFLTTCEASYSVACNRGKTCDSFFFRAKFNSVAHCENELGQQLQEVVDKMSTEQRESCARTCQVMADDAANAPCEDFDQMVFNSYSCGN